MPEWKGPDNCPWKDSLSLLWHLSTSLTVDQPAPAPRSEAAAELTLPPRRPTFAMASVSAKRYFLVLGRFRIEVICGFQDAFWNLYKGLHNWLQRTAAIWRMSLRKSRWRRLSGKIKPLFSSSVLCMLAVTVATSKVRCSACLQACRQQTMPSRGTCSFW